MNDPDPIPCPRNPPPNEAAEEPNMPENRNFESVFWLRFGNIFTEIV
jgi:hypothetical protein